MLRRNDNTALQEAADDAASELRAANERLLKTPLRSLRREPRIDEHFRAPVRRHADEQVVGVLLERVGDDDLVACGKEGLGIGLLQLLALVQRRDELGVNLGRMTTKFDQLAHAQRGADG